MLRNFKTIGMLALAMVWSAVAGTEIILPESAQVKPGYVRLGEIAKLNEDVSGSVARVFIGKAPKVGSEAVITREWVIRRLKATGLYNGIEITGADKVILKGVAEIADAADNGGKHKTETASTQKTSYRVKAYEEAKDYKPEPVKKVIVKVEEEEFTDDPAFIPKKAVAANANVKSQEDVEKEREQRNKLAISRAIKQYVANRLGQKDAEVVAVVRGYKLTEQDYFSIKVDGISRGALTGRSELTLFLCSPQGKVIGFGEADVNIAVSVKVAILVRALRKDEVVRRGDVEIRCVQYKPGIPLECANPDEFVGRISSKTLRAGDAVCPGDFNSTLDVVKGKPLTLIASRSGFQIKEMVLALSDGRKGDYIKVQSVADSSRSYTVVITGPGTADVPSAGNVPSEKK